MSFKIKKVSFSNNMNKTNVDNLRWAQPMLDLFLKALDNASSILEEHEIETPKIDKENLASFRYKVDEIYWTHGNDRNIAMVLHALDSLEIGCGFGLSKGFQ